MSRSQRTMAGGLVILLSSFLGPKEEVLKVTGKSCVSTSRPDVFTAAGRSEAKAMQIISCHGQDIQLILAIILFFLIRVVTTKKVIC